MKIKILSFLLVLMSFAIISHAQTIVVSGVGGITTGCSNVTYPLTSTITGAFAPITYQWFSNTTPIVGATGANYTYNGGSVGDSIWCRLSCLNSNGNPIIVNSNAFVVNVLSATPAVNISTFTNPSCAGVNVTIIAAGSNLGSAPTRSWYKNWVLVTGVTGNTYSSTSFANGDVIHCVAISSSTNCLTTNIDTSSALILTVNPSVVPNITINSLNASGCSGGVVNFTSTTVNGGVGPVKQWQVNGVAVATGTNYSSGALNNGDVVRCVLTSNAVCAVPPKDTSNTITVNVFPIVTPAVTIVNNINNVCAALPITLWALPVNGGLSPVYDWKVNGTSTGITIDTFSQAFFNNGDIVTCEMTTSEPCATTPFANSNAITINVTPALSPDVFVTAAPSNIVCSGVNITFSATPTNGGAAPTYIWKVNGTIQVGATGTTFAPTNLITGSVVECVMTSTESCVTAITASSNTIPVVIKPLVTPIATILSTADSICFGDFVFFSASLTEPGNSPAFIWQLDNVNVGTLSAYNTNTLAVGTHTITLTMQSSSNKCLSANPVVSNTLTVYVRPLVTPAVTITPSANNICFGIPIVFTSNVTNGGPTTTYNWTINGLPISGNNPSITSFNINNNDVVQVGIISTEKCASPNNGFSNTLTMTIKPLVTPFVRIDHDTNGVCNGDRLRFFIDSVSKQGPTPTYMWQLNGINTGITTDTFTSTTFVNADLITVVLTSSEECPSPVSIISIPDTVLIYPPATPDVQIASNDTSICISNNVIFTTTIVDGGTNPTYQWFWNGLPHGPLANTYSNTLLEDKDFIYCVMASNKPCLTKPNDTSNSIIMTVEDNVSPEVTVTQSTNSASTGSAITYTANTTVLPPYTIQWFRNGIFITASASNIWNTNVVLPNDSVYAKILGFTGCYLLPTGTSPKVWLTPLSISGNAPINFGIYPNPTHTSAIMSNVENGDIVLLYDITGKLVYQTKVNITGNYILDMSAYAVGSYQVKCIRDKAVWVSRLIKE